MIEKLHIYIAILAALIVDICCIVMSNPLYLSVLYIIAAIVVFYVIGLFVRNFIIKCFYTNNNDTLSQNENTDEMSDEISETEGVLVSNSSNDENVA